MVKQLKQEENQKVKNTKKIFYDKIWFKSQLEVKCYKELINNGFNPVYENVTFNLFDKFRAKQVLYYCPYNIKKKGVFGIYPRIIMGITYTPDFYFLYKGNHIYFDTKGYPNDVYPLKKKIFLKVLEDLSNKTGEKYIFFEPHNMSQIRECISIILKL